MKKKRKKNQKKIQRRQMRGMFSFLFVGFLIICIGYCFHPIFLIHENVDVGINEEYDPKDNISCVFLGDVKDVSVKEKIKTNKLGTKTFHYVYKNKEYEGTYTVIDKTEPELTLKTYTTDLVEDVDPKSFVESCKDDSDVTYEIVSKDISDEGENTVKIKATDAYGNSTTAETTLIRQKDTEAPSVADVAPIINVLKGNSFDYLSELGATDNVDPNPTVKANKKVNFDKAGNYDLTFTVSDRSGNEVTVSQTINVIDATEDDAKVVYLTFDDGPSYDVTPQILDTLNKYHAKATFFVIGTSSSANPDMLKREYEEGHSIGLHSYTHEYSIYTSQETYFEDLQEISDLVEEEIGKKIDIIRFPGGSSNTISANYCTGIMSQLVDAVEAKGYEYYDWDVSSGDASGNGVAVETIVEGATSGTDDHLTILFHDTSAKATTAEALPQIIEYYEAQGYVFLGLNKDTSYAAHQGTAN